MRPCCVSSAHTGLPTAKLLQVEIGPLYIFHQGGSSHYNIRGKRRAALISSVNTPTIVGRANKRMQSRNQSLTGAAVRNNVRPEALYKSEFSVEVTNPSRSLVSRSWREGKSDHRESVCGGDRGEGPHAQPSDTCLGKISIYQRVDRVGISPPSAGSL